MKPDGSIEHRGRDRDPDWYVEPRPDGTAYWRVTDWTGEVVAHGVTPTITEAVVKALSWTEPDPDVPRETPTSEESL